MTTTQDHTAISISMDGTWAGSGKLINGRIEDCGAQFCDDNDSSLWAYDKIEQAIVEGKSSIRLTFSGDETSHEFTWSIVEPMAL